MSDRDDRAADALADREPVECPECGGRGIVLHLDGFDTCDYCPECGGTGVWKGRP